MPTRLSNLDCFSAGVAGGKPAVKDQTFGNLFADTKHRIQRGHRLLEDHRYKVAPHPAHFFLRQQEKILAFKENLAGDSSTRSVNKAHYGISGNAFAATGFSYNCQGLPFGKGKIHTVHSLYDSP